MKLAPRISGRMDVGRVVKPGTVFHALSDAAPVMIWMTDRNNAGIYFNKRWLDFTGIPMRLQLGEGWTKNVHPDDLHLCLRTFRKAVHDRAVRIPLVGGVSGPIHQPEGGRAS